MPFFSKLEESALLLQLAVRANLKNFLAMPKLWRSEVIKWLYKMNRPIYYPTINGKVSVIIGL